MTVGRPRAIPLEQVRELWEQDPGIKGTELAARVGVSVPTAQRWLRELRGPAYGVKRVPDDDEQFWAQVHRTQQERFRA